MSPEVNEYLRDLEEARAFLDAASSWRPIRRTLPKLRYVPYTDTTDTSTRSPTEPLPWTGHMEDQGNRHERRAEWKRRNRRRKP